MPRSASVSSILAVAGFFAFSCLGCAGSAPGGPDSAPAPAAAANGVVSLDQGWSAEEQEWFWFTSQGSRILPYDWFLALEQAESAEPFRADANVERFRYLVARPSRLNPDGLPVGFAKDTDRRSGQSWVGWTCAACHTGQVDYQGTRLRVDGGPTMSDSIGFLDALVEALQATGRDDAKFERFARAVLGESSNQEAASALRQQLAGQAESLAERQRRVRPPSPYGFARLDAFGGIFNAVLAEDLALPENYQPGTAPVSYPFLWDTPQCDLVQWNGIAPNSPPGFGPLARNVGEVLGVFGAVDVDPERFPRGYESSADLVALGELEKKLEKLWSPQWPAGTLPALDADKAARGAETYRQQCASCHALIDRTDPKRRIQVVMTPVGQVGTDPAMAENAAVRMARTGRLEGTKELFLTGERLGPEATGVQVLDAVVIGTILGQPLKALESSVEEFLRVKAAQAAAEPAYKARPLNGIWATAPYLHNGSVPNLWELLRPPAERVRTFYVGSRELDPVRVGFDIAPFPGGFDLDTTLPGNSNAGHPYGTRLTDEQRWDLIEYLKSL